MVNVLQIQNVSKRYPGVVALDNLTLEVNQGSIFGLLGPNGSGKTTTLGIVLGVLQATAGSFSWFGKALTSETKRRVGAILETPNFYPYLTAQQNLKIVADIKRISHHNIEPVLELVGLHARRHTTFKGFSLGMKQRLSLASALLGNPEVLILDEPTNGLDPEGIVEVRELIRKVAREGKTIIMASHLLDEVEKVCTHVAVLQKGQLRVTGPVSSILTQHDQVVISTEAPMRDKAYQFLKEAPQVQDIREEKEDFVLTLTNGVTSGELNKILFAHGIILSQLMVRKKSLETEFLDIIKEKPLS